MGHPSAHRCHAHKAFPDGLSCNHCRRQRNRDAALVSYYNRKQHTADLQKEVRPPTAAPAGGLYDH